MLKSLENRLDALDSRVSENSSKQFETKSSQAARLSSAEKRLDQCESILTDQAQSLRAVQEKPSPPPGVSEQFEVKVRPYILLVAAAFELILTIFFSSKTT